MWILLLYSWRYHRQWMIRFHFQRSYNLGLKWLHCLITRKRSMLLIIPCFIFLVRLKNMCRYLHNNSIHEMWQNIILKLKQCPTKQDFWWRWEIGKSSEHTTKLNDHSIMFTLPCTWGHLWSLLPGLKVWVWFPRSTWQKRTTSGFMLPSFTIYMSLHMYGPSDLPHATHF